MISSRSRVKVSDSNFSIVMMILMVIILIICGVWLWKRRKLNPDEPPSMPGSLPLIGHAYRLIGNRNHLWETLKDINKEIINSDGVLRIKVGLATYYAISEPEDSLTVANTCLQKDAFYDFAKPWLGDGLITGSLPIWKRHRKLLSPAFSQAVLDGFLEVLNKQALRLVDDLAVEVGRGPFNHWAYTQNNSLQTICMTSMGMDSTDVKSSIHEFAIVLGQFHKIIIKRFQRVWLHNSTVFKFTDLKKKEDKCVKFLHNISNSILEKRKSVFLRNKDDINQEKKSDARFKPFMDLLLELSIEKGALNDQEIKDEINTMIAAGHDTTAAVLMYTMLLIGSYPHVQDRINKELHEVFGDDNRDVTKQDLSQLVYIEAVLKESMRMYPIAPVIIRRLDRDVKLRNCTLSSGRSCFIFLYGILHHPMWGPDVEEFKPERWLDPASLPECASNLAAFSFGRRVCIGKAYAYTAMKITLAQVMRHYRIKGDHTKLKLQLDVVLKPMSGHYISIENKNNNIYI